MKKRAAKDFEEEGWQGRVQYQQRVDIRYRGQGYELNLPFTRNLQQAFEREHKRRYGYAHPSRELELVTLRLRAVVKSTTGHLRSGTVSRLGQAKLGPPSTPKVEGFFDGKKLSTAIYAREALKPGRDCSGPAIVTEYSATTVIPPGKRFHLDRTANLIVTIR